MKEAKKTAQVILSNLEIYSRLIITQGGIIKNEN